MGDSLGRATEDTIEQLRELSERLYEFGAGKRVFFPPKEGRERLPLKLEGYVPVRRVARHLRYIADMLE